MSSAVPSWNMQCDEKKSIHQRGKQVKMSSRNYGHPSPYELPLLLGWFVALSWEKQLVILLSH